MGDSKALRKFVYGLVLLWSCVGSQIFGESVVSYVTEDGLSQVEYKIYGDKLVYIVWQGPSKSSLRTRVTSTKDKYGEPTSASVSASNGESINVMGMAVQIKQDRIEGKVALPDLKNWQEFLRTHPKGYSLESFKKFMATKKKPK